MIEKYVNNEWKAAARRKVKNRTCIGIGMIVNFGKRRLEHKRLISSGLTAE